MLKVLTHSKKICENLQNFAYQVEKHHFCSSFYPFSLIYNFTQLEIRSFVSPTEISGVSSGCQQGGCLTCSDYNGCLSCKPRFFMHLERIGMKQIGVCMTSCPPGFYGTRFPERSPCTSKRFVCSLFLVFFKSVCVWNISIHCMCKCMAVNISPICVTVLWFSVLNSFRVLLTMYFAWTWRIQAPLACSKS